MREFILEKKFVIIVAGSILLILGGIWFYYHQNNDILVLDQDTLDGNGNLEDQQGEPKDQQEDGIEEETSKIMVHIIGQIKKPGVLILDEGSRLIEAIEKLGGPLEDADLDAVNLAQKLNDEQKIYIPKKGEIQIDGGVFPNGNMIGNGQQDSRININSCSKEELKTLPGIGDVISENIIEYREKNGGFKSIEEIKEVNRIGDKIFNDIKDRIKI